jgi:acid phosphatase type 7
LYSNFESVRDDREILIDLNTKVTDEIVEGQTKWLRNVLENNPQQWTIIVYHHPMFTGREDRYNYKLQDQWRELFREYEVDLVLQGHDHAYGRGRDPAMKEKLGEDHTGPVYTISVAGSKMRPLDRTGEALDWADITGENVQLYQSIEVDGGILTYSAWLATGELFDRFRIVKDEQPFNRFEDLKPGHPFEFEW